MKVLWLSKVPPERHSTRIRELGRRLAERGHEVTVLTTRTAADLPARDWVDGVDTRYLATAPRWLRGEGRVRFYATRLPWYVVAPLAVRRLAREMNPDVIIEDLAPVGAPLVTMVARRLHIPVILDAHYLLGSPAAWLRLYGVIGVWGATYSWLLRRGSIRPAGLISDSRSLVAELSARTPWLAPRWLPNGVDAARFRIDRRAPAKDRPVEIITVGRCVTPKGQRFLIEAVGLVDRALAVRLTIVGDGPLRASLETLTAELGLSDRVTFHGWMDHSDLPAALGRADILVMPSLAEGLPVALIEAMGSGLPIIATDIPGHRQVADDDALHLVPPANASAIAAAISDLAADSARRLALGARARAVAHESYEWSRIVDDLESILRGARVETRR